MKRKILWVFVAIIVISCVLLKIFLGSHFFGQGKIEPEGRGLFSWKSPPLADGGTEMMSFMKQHGFTEVYQWLSDSLEEPVITTFLHNAKTEGIAVYMLTGDPSWAKDLSGEKLLKKVEKAVHINQTQGTGGGIKGLIFDVEPYLLDEWNTDSASIMEGFVDIMSKVYLEASKQNLEVVLCIPYYYDSQGYQSQLEALIGTGCDRVAVMNYYKGTEAKQIETEVAYAQKYGKSVINIYEFKAPGQHDIVEMNTYYHDGFDVAVQNYFSLKELFPDVNMIMAAHDYGAVKEILTTNEGGLAVE